MVLVCHGLLSAIVVAASFIVVKSANFAGLSVVCATHKVTFLVFNSMKTTDVVTSSPPSSSSSDLGSDTMPALVIMTVSSGCNDLWYESCMVGDFVVNFLIDTDSQAIVLPYSLAVKSGLAISPVSSAVLRAYGGGKVEVVGKIPSATITFHSQSHSGDIVVTADDTRPILGMDFYPIYELFGSVRH